MTTWPHGGAAQIYRDQENGSAHQPSKAEIRAYGRALEASAARSLGTRAEALLFDVPSAVEQIALSSPHGIPLLYEADTAGTALTTADGRNWSPSGLIYPDHFGENTTPGTTDMTSAAQAAIDYIETLSDGGVLTLHPAVKYFFDSTVTVAESNIQIHAHGATIVADPTLGPEAQNRPDGVFNFIGQQAAFTDLSSDASEGATSITVDSVTGMAVGQTVTMFNATGGSGFVWYTDSFGSVFRHFITRIVAISGNTLTIADPLPFDFDATTYTCRITTWDGIRNVGIRGGTWDGGGYDHSLVNGRGNALAFCEYCHDVTIEPERVTGFSGAAVWCVRVHGFKFTCDSMEGHRDTHPVVVEGDGSQGFYGIRMDDCKNCIVGGFSANRMRHVTDGTRAWDVYIHDIIATNSHRPPYGSHNGCSNWQHKNLTSRGISGGILWRGFDCIVDGLFVDCPNDSEAAFYDVAGASGDLKRSYQLSNFVTNMARESIRLEADIDSCQVIGGFHKGAGESESYNVIDINTTRMNSFEMIGGVIEGTSFRQVDAEPAATKRGVIKFIGTEFRGYTRVAVRCRAVDDETAFIMRDVHLKGDGGNVTHVDEIGTFLNYEVTATLEGTGAYSEGGQSDVSESVVDTLIGDSSNDATMHATASKATVTLSKNRVTMSGEIRLTSKGSVTGNVLLKSLPHNVASGSQSGGGGIVTWVSGMDSGFPDESITIRALGGGTSLGFYKGNRAQPLVGADLTDTTRMAFQLTYMKD